MSAIVDYTYYSTVYMGTEADEASFPALCARAEDVIGAMARWQDPEAFTAFQTLNRVLIHVNPQQLHNLVKAVCRTALEGIVCISCAAHTVHNVTALVAAVNHAVNGIDVILQVCIHGNDGIAFLANGHHACKQCILMSLVMGKLDASEQIICLVQRANQLPCFVL